MDINLQESFDHHMSVARALCHDVQLEAFQGTIRVRLFSNLSVLILHQHDYVLFYLGFAYNYTNSQEAQIQADRPT